MEDAARMEFWSMHSAGCGPDQVPQKCEELLQGFQQLNTGAQILRIEHQTCSIGSPSQPQILLTMLIHFRI